MKLSDSFFSATKKIFTYLVLIFLILPVIVIVPLSFTSGSLLTYPLPGASLRWYESLIADPAWMRAFLNSLIIATATAVISTFLGTMAALGLMGGNQQVKKIAFPILLAPMVIPVVVSAVGIFYAYTRIGLAGSYLGVIIAHTTVALPLVVITIFSALQSFDSSLERAASNLGARPLTVFRSVTLPLVAPGVIAGALFAFSTSFDELLIAMYISPAGEKTLPRQLFDAVQYNIDPNVASASTIIILMSAVTLAAITLLRRG